MVAQRLKIKAYQNKIQEALADSVQPSGVWERKRGEEEERVFPLCKTQAQICHAMREREE
jgi:hypothetical protein